LREANIPSEMIENCLINIAKENQLKSVENLRKKGLFAPELSNKQWTDIKTSQRKSAAAAPGSAKKEDAGKKKK
jgi:hypothetical protein